MTQTIKQTPTVMTTTEAAQNVFTIINQALINAVNEGLIQEPRDLISLIKMMADELNLDIDVVKSAVFKISEKLNGK